MTNAIKAVVFDLEGTVVDVEAAHHHGHIAAAADVGVGLTIESCFKSIPHFIGGPDEKIAEEIASLANDGRKMETVNPAYVLERDRYHYERLLKEMAIKPRPGFIDAFEFFKKKGLKLAIGSLTAEKQARTLLDNSGLSGIFDPAMIVLREHVKNPKPAPDVWIEAARRAGVPTSEMLVFEDSPRGIVGATLVGAICIGMPVYNRPDVIQSLLDAGAREVFLDWREIDCEKLLNSLS